MCVFDFFVFCFLGLCCPKKTLQTLNNLNRIEIQNQIQIQIFNSCRQAHKKVLPT